MCAMHAWHMSNITQLGNMKVAESRGSVGPMRPPFRIHRHMLGTGLKHLNLMLQTVKKEREKPNRFRDQKDQNTTLKSCHARLHPLLTVQDLRSSVGCMQGNEGDRQQ